jgi:hypothetical protein
VVEGDHRIIAQQLHVHRLHTNASLQEVPPPATADCCHRRCIACVGNEHEKNKIALSDLSSLTMQMFSF